MGIDVELVEGVGPVVAEPIATAADVERLQRARLRAAFSHVLEAVADRPRASSSPSGRSSGSAAARSPSPGYLVEGKPSRDFVTSRRR